MINLPKLSDLNVEGKRALVRADLDVDFDTKTNDEDIRLKSIIPTLEYLVEKNSEVIIIGHRGRPGGKIDENLSLEPISKIIGKLLKEKIGEEKMKRVKMEMLENLRFNPGEEANDGEFTRHLAGKGDVYVNEAFANSHREHASIIGLPKLLPHAAGFHFLAEVENLSKVLEKPKKPVVVLLGGVKKDKLDYLEGIKKFADKILVGGRLPEYLEQDTRYSILDTKILVANLLPDKEDITINSIEKFEEEIAKAGTIVLAGPMGKYEDEGHRQGTERIFKAVASSKAFRVAGGGDTEKAISFLSPSTTLGINSVEGFDWVSVGGGAMLEFLAKGTLPGIQALNGLSY